MCRIQILPQATGWIVVGCSEPLFFQSGRWAERTARRLAAARALDGESVELEVNDRSGALVARLLFPAMGVALKTAA